MIDTDKIPDHIENLIHRTLHALPPPPPGHVGVSSLDPELAREVEALPDTDIEMLINEYTRSERPQSQRDTIGKLIHIAGQRAIPFIAKALKAESGGVKNIELVRVLIGFGEPALQTVEDVFFALPFEEAYTALLFFYQLGSPAAHMVAYALEHPDGHIASRVIHKVSESSISEIQTIVRAVIDELIVRKPNCPDRFNDKITANYLKSAINRSPQLYRQIQTELCNLAFQDDPKVRERALQVAQNLDADDFMQLVRARAEEHPEIAAKIMYLLGRSETLPAPQKSLKTYTDQLQDLEKRSLARWDDMAGQSRINFWLRNGMTVLFFIAGLVVIGTGLWLLVAGNDPAKQVVGGAVSALTAIGGMLVKFWQAPVTGIRDSFVQQAGVETTFIGFMTRTGQIRLLFEQSFAKGEITIEALGSYQKMVAEAQSQTAQELALIKTKPESKA